jgi:SdrD B-like domain/Secretion system C-terminal sorting domain
MKKVSLLLLVTIFLLAINLTTEAQVSGIVFRDFNGNGTRQNTSGTFVEPVVSGIVINAYNTSDALVATQTTSTAGTYTFPASGANSIASGAAVRLEFVIPITGVCGLNPFFDFSTFKGTGNGTSVQFVTGGAAAININYGIFDPSQYVFDTAPFSNTYLFTSLLFFGNPTASPAGTAANQRAFVKFPYNRSGNSTGLSASEILATNSQIGTTYGVAYSKQANKVFTSAFMKRHAGFGPSNGTFNNAPGTIYIIDPTKNSSTGAASYFTSLDALGFPTHNTTGTPAYGSATSYTITVPVAGTGPSWFARQEKINYVGAGAGVIGTNVQRGLNKDSSVATNDPAAYDQIGKVSLGDMEISDDGQYLFVTNLFDRKIYQLQLNSITNPTSATVVTSWALPSPPLRSTSGLAGAAATYTGANDNTDFYTGLRGFQRPFGLKYYKGKVYVGALTTGEGTSGVTTKDNNTGNPEYTDLWSYVWELTPSSGFSTTPVVQFPMNYNRTVDTDGIEETFNAWTSTMPAVSTDFFGYPQPILAGIEFDVDGSMIIAFRDRIGDQSGTANYLLSTATTAQRTVESYGDILRAYRNSSCTGWIVEANGDKDGPGPYTATAAQQNNQGPSNYTSGNGEFYYQDGLEIWGGVDNLGTQLYHLNTNEGALAIIPGSEEIAGTTMDPMRYVSQGISWQNNNTGTNPRDYELYVGTTFNVNPGEPAKGNGLGDMELLISAAPIEIGNRVWNDVNGDGIQEAGEAGIAGVTLEFVDGAGNPVDSDPSTAGVQPTFVTTDATGNWYLTSATGTDAIGINYGVALLPNTNYKVRLATGVTDDWDPAANGGAGGPRAGQQLVGYRLTKTSSIGTGAANLSDNDAAMLSSIPQVSITTGVSGANNHNIDFGFTKLASLGNRVWLDEGAGGGTRANGVQDGTEPGVAGVAVNLYQNGADGLPNTADDVLVGSTITDAYGNYLFDNLVPTDQTNATTIAQTTYFIRITAPSNYSITTQTNTTDYAVGGAPAAGDITGSDVNVLGQSYGINLSAGENDPHVDAGLIFKPQAIPNSIGDKVWLDNGAGALAGNGVQDAGEPGVAGVTVTLYDDATGNIVAITTTDANGNYLFNNLPANTNYKVGFSAPAGTVLTTGGVLSIGNATTNSDPNPATGLTTTINTGVAGTQITGVDAGLKNDPKGVIGDFVWNDLNNNGIQDAGEPGIPGVTMTLYNVGADGIQGNGDDGPTLTTTTDANGYYVFTNLDPSKYVVAAAPVAGYTNSAAVQGTNKTKDNNFIPGVAGVFAGKYVSNVVELKPTAGGVTRDMTIDLGIHSTTAINTLNTLGNRVWNDVNKDGLQTAGEAGVANVTVRLLTSAGAAVNNPATGKPYVVATDANGNYKFVDLPDGNYIIEFANLPAGFVFTTKDAAGSGAPGSGTDTDTDSDASTTTGRTGVIDLDAAVAIGTSVNIVSVDAGITQGTPAGTASLGNRVWYDVNNNGTQDAGELGVNNVKVELLDASGVAVNVPGTSTPYIIYTNALGEYLFTGLPAGDYKVKFSGLPSSFTYSAANVGADDAIDSDGTSIGTTTATTSTTSTYTLQTGEDNLTVDLGIVPPTAANSANNSLGNFVWSDLDGDGKQTAGEPGVQGVMVSLYTNGADGLPGTADDVLVGVTTTDNNGAYGFVGLADGNYNVGFSNLPAGYSFTAKDAVGFTAANGSDANTASGRTGTIALDPGGASGTGINNPDVDAGIITTRAVLGNQVWLDTDGDGLLNNGEKGVSGVTVTLYDDATGAVLACTITDADGKYYFGNLLPGDYKVGFSTIPSNLSFTKQTTAGVTDNSINNNSDADPATGLTTKITLTAGETDLTIDAGLKPDNLASVGDFVWNDLDALGTQSAGEPGVPGIIVTLYDANTNAVVGTAITDGNGKYLISKIPVAAAGTSFYIIFSNLPAGALFTTQTDNVTAGDATLGSDANTATGRTSNFTLIPGQYLPTVDAGIKNIQLLPIKITSFTAVPKGNQVNLQWIVSEQGNVATYEVETSADGRNFANITTVSSNGNQGATYDAVHIAPVVGINYYRIKTVEKDGAISYSEIRKVTFGKGGDVIIYPNPVSTGVVNISLTGSMIGKSATVSILSMDGKLISQQQIANTSQTETIDVSRLANGSYVVRLITTTEVVNKTIQVIR